MCVCVHGRGESPDIQIMSLLGSIHTSYLATELTNVKTACIKAKVFVHLPCPCSYQQ